MQLESARVRYVVNLARALGLVLGCLIGMFPLLFYDGPPAPAPPTDDPDPAGAQAKK